jgi:DNA-binding MarR family transcriptional regulator
MNGADDALIDGLSALSRVLVGITVRTLAKLDVDLTLPQFRTIVLLASRGPQRSIDLAAALGLHPSTVTRTCDRLVRRGLVGREHREADRRVAWVALTEDGKRLVGEVVQRRAVEIRELLAGRSIDGQTPAIEVLDALVMAAGELPERQWWQRWSASTQVSG